MLNESDVIIENETHSVGIVDCLRAYVLQEDVLSKN